MSSWIKLFRDINKHWIWQNSDYLKWWLDILLEVNHAPAKVVINNKIYDCNRGEKLYSLDTWAARWGTNKSKVRRFLQLLQNDNMIVLKSETQTTRLTVCKYDTYQDMRNGDETHLKRKRNACETHLTPIEEGKEEKEGKELFLLEKETKEENLSKENPLEIFPESESVETGTEERKKVAQKKERYFNKEDFKKKLLDLGVEEKHANDWIQIRKDKRASFTESAIDGIIRECEKHNFPFSEAIKNCAESNWQGFKYEWIKNKNQNSNGITNTTNTGFSNNATVSNGKVSGRSIVADRISQHLARNSESGNHTIDIEANIVR